MAFSKQDIVINFMWKFAERCGAQGISFVVTIILARLLLPSDYGVVALAQVLLTILSVFVDNGMGNALIQKKEVDDLDFSSVFYLNTIIGVVLYVNLWCIAPQIASFYEVPELEILIRVMGITLIVAALRNVQQAYVARNMIFKRFFYATLSSSIVSAIIGISMAIAGLGVWALVTQQLMSALVGTGVLWATVPWRPMLRFSFQRVRNLFSYGGNLLLSALLDTGYNQLWQLLIGKFYSPSDLAFFNQGNKFPNLIVTNVNMSIDSILLPVMSSEQDDCKRVREMTRRAMTTSVFVMAPIMMIMIFSATNIVTLLLTDKWIPCVPFFCIFCIYYMFYPLHTANLNAIKALGRSGLFLKMEILKKVIGLSILLYTMRYGAVAMAYGMLVTGFISQIINSWPNKKILEYGYFHQLCDVCPAIILAIVAGAVSWCAGSVVMPLWLVVIFQVFSGGVAYIFMAWIFELESLKYVYSLVVNK